MAKVSIGMHLMFSPEKVITSPMFLLPSNADVTAEELQPTHWRNCWLNGIRLSWNFYFGLPQLFLHSFRTGIPEAIQKACQPEHGYRHTLIQDTWTGTQQPCWLRGAKTSTSKFTAVIWKYGPLVKMELKHEGSPTQALDYYFKIRTGDFDEFVSLTPLDRPSSNSSVGTGNDKSKKDKKS